MARKPPSLEHVKYVPCKRTGKVYPYFNTGMKRPNGQPIRVRLPDPGAPNFFEVYGAMKAGRTKRAAPSYTVERLCDDYMAAKAFTERAASTQANYANQIVKIKEVWGKFPADKLEAHHVRTVIEGDMWPPATAYMVLAVVGAVYKFGRRSKGLKHNPTADIERPEYGSHDPWPDHVLEAALESDDDVVRLAVHLLYFTGQRIGDAMRMRWSDIRDGNIYVKQQKTRKIVEPRLMSDLVAELDRTPRNALTIISGIKEGALRRRLQAFTRAMGHETVPHGLRKNAVNAFLLAGSTVAEVAAITGQTHAVVEEYASKIDRRRLGNAAVIKLEAARRKAKA